MIKDTRMSGCPSQRQPRPAYALLWGLLILLYLIPPLHRLDEYAWDYDEGPLMQAAALAREGHRLYDEVALNKFPHLVWWVQAGFALGRTDPASARLAVLLLNLLGFVSLGALAERWWGRGAGPATLALALLLAEGRARAAVVMPDLLAASLALVAWMAATRYRERRDVAWLLACAAAFALAVGLHPLLLHIGVPLLWVLVGPDWSRDLRGSLRAVVAFGAVGLGVLGATLLLVDRAGFARWVYAYNAAAARNARHFPSWERVWGYLGQHWPLALAALGGTVALAQSRRDSRRRRLGLSASLVWSYLTLLALGLYRPLWRHYLILLLYPLLLLAGGGVWAGLRDVRRLRWRALPGAVALLGAVIFAAQQAVAPPPVQPTWPAGHAAARAYLAAAAEPPAPGDVLLYDNPYLAFAHGYRVPPALADTSFKRIANGYLRPGDVGAAVVRHAVRWIVLDGEGGRFYVAPELVQAVAALAEPPRCFEAVCVYRVAPRQPFEARVGDAVRLRGYALSPAPVQAGETLTVTLLWESLGALAPVPGESTVVFVHLRDAAGNPVAQHDGPPLFGMAPPEAWSPGHVVPDPHPVPLDAALPPGVYTLAVGMYRWPSLVRLPAQDAAGARWGDDVIVLGPVSVQ